MVQPPAPPAPRRAGLARRLADDERVRFLGAGVVNTGIGAVAFIGLQLTLGRVAHYLVVLLAAHVVAVLCAFTLHRRHVFRVHGTGSWLVDLARYEVVYLGALAVNLLLLPLLVEVGGLEVIPAQLLIVAVTALVSFLGHKHFSFRRPAP